MDMGLLVKSIIKEKEKKKVNVHVTGGHMNNLDIIKEQMTY